MESSNPPPWVDRPEVQSRDTTSGGRCAAEPEPAAGLEAVPSGSPDGFARASDATAAPAGLAARDLSYAARDAGSPISSQAALIADIRTAASSPPVVSG
jgi:hypothetical protein